MTKSTLVPITTAWAQNSINANILRHNAVVTHGDRQTVAFYDADGVVTLAVRTLGTDAWDIKRTPYTGNVRDAHNVISIMVDGAGYLHVAWDHHNNPLRYCRSVAPGSLDLTELLPMTGLTEERVTYPEFYRLPDGNLIFLYRDGASGRGNLMLNHYDCATQRWTQRQDAFIHGEDERNAYWQMCADVHGTLHISWVWRETPDVATNHDICYAKSPDGGITWQTSTGTPYKLPITAATAEYAAHVPQASELINTTSMCADAQGRPYIATYWRPAGTEVPQYHLVYHDGAAWHTTQISNRQTPFTLAGPGTKRVPISRCRIVADARDTATRAYLLFRDVERGDKVSVAVCRDLRQGEWTVEDLTAFPVGLWEPSYDTELWEQKKQLHVYVQAVGQGDGEGVDDLAAQMVSILEWQPDDAGRAGATRKS